MTIPAIEIIGNKMKIKYQNMDWNQRNPDLDIFTNIEQVKAYCGNFGDSMEETTCWLDTYNWSLMNKTPLTEDIYQFISHRAGVIRGGFDSEITKWKEAGGVNWEVFKPIWEMVMESTTLDFILLILEGFGL